MMVRALLVYQSIIVGLQRFAESNGLVKYDACETEVLDEEGGVVCTDPMKAKAQWSPPMSPAVS
jgi:hypothetical protein